MHRKKNIEKNINFYSKLRLQYYLRKKPKKEKFFYMKGGFNKKIMYLNKKILKKKNILVYYNYYRKLKHLYKKFIVNLRSNLKIFSVRYKKFSFFNPKFSFFNPANLKLVNHFVSFKLFKFSKKFKSKKYILRKNIFKPFKFKEKFKPRYLKYKKFAIRKINKLKKRKFFKNFYFLLNNYSNRKLLNFGVKYRFNYHYNFSYNYLKYYLLCLKYFYKLNYRQNKIK